METKNRITGYRATHPGEILREELLARGIRQKDFAQLIGMQPSHLNEFLKGKTNLNANLAMQLEKQLGIPFQSWMTFQNNYIYDSMVIAERKAASECPAKHTVKADKQKTQAKPSHRLAHASV